MSLVVPVDYSAVRKNSHLGNESAGYTVVPAAGRVQMMGLPQLPSGTGVHSPFSSIYIQPSACIPSPVDGSAFSKSIVCQNIHHPVSTAAASASKYVGLPYQDHNYVMLPPSTPPPSPSCLQPVGHPLPKPGPCLIEGNDNISFDPTVITTDDSITRCICEFQHDDGYMIQCDKCGVWQHVDCMEVDRDNIPESYLCELCEPRKVDKHRAIQIQTRKRDALSVQHMDSSATETEDETTDGRRRSFDKSPVKKELEELEVSTLSTVALTKKRKTKSKRDERLKRKLQLKRQTSGQKSPVSSLKKVQYRPLSTDGIVETVRQDSVTSQNNTFMTFTTPVSATIPPSIEIYQEAGTNSYTTELQNLLASIKFNGQQSAACAPSVFERLLVGPSCLVAPVTSARMGLEACEDILTNQPLIEYIGKVMLRDQYEKENVFYRWPEPNVLFYSKLGGLDLCIDASSYGNMARFVRRSCTPNAEVRHLLEGNTVRFFICATKSIVCGAEITIPFDFNYHKCLYVVDCACTRVSCPVAKFHRREASHSLGPAAKRQRTCRSVEIMSMQEQAVLSPKKLSSSVQMVLKQGKSPVQNNESNMLFAETKTVKSPEIKTEPPSVKVEPAALPLSPAHHSLSGSPVTAAESDSIHASQFFSASVAAATTVQATSAVTTSASLSDADEIDKSKKKTREEKKLEAIMKAFERMEKREERKKEAQYRQEHTKVKELPRAKDTSKKVRERTDSKSASDVPLNDSKPVVTEHSSNARDMGESSMAEVPVIVKAESKTKIKRSRQTSRRSSVSLVNDGNSMTSGPTAVLTSDEVSCQSGGALPSAPPAAAAAAPLCAISIPMSTSSPVASVAETITTFASSERLTGFPTGFPKKLLMRGHELSKQLSIKTEGLEMGGADGGEFGTDFVQCVPSPQSLSLSTLRRNSMPAVNSNGNNNGDGHAKRVPSVSVLGSSQADTKGCSAKKRWLHQAMYDKTELQPVGEDAVVPGRPPFANGTSPTDFVTPLKKRRLARESLSTESPPPPPPPPPVPSVTAASLSVQEVDNRATAVFAPQYESISDDEHTDFEESAGVDNWRNCLAASNTTDVNHLSENLVAPANRFLPMHNLQKETYCVDMSRSLLCSSKPENVLLMPGCLQLGYPSRTVSNYTIREEDSMANTMGSVSNGFRTGIHDELIPTSITKCEERFVRSLETEAKMTDPVHLHTPQTVAVNRENVLVSSEEQSWPKSALSVDMSGGGEARVTHESGIPYTCTDQQMSDLSHSGLLDVQLNNVIAYSQTNNINPSPFNKTGAAAGYVFSAISPLLTITPVEFNSSDAAVIQGLDGMLLENGALGQSSKTESDLVSGVQTTSLSQTISSQALNIQSSNVTATASEAQNGLLQNWIQNQVQNQAGKEYEENGCASNDSYLWTSTPWTDGNHGPKLHGFFNVSLASSFLTSNCVPSHMTYPHSSNLVTISGGNIVPAMLCDHNSFIMHSGSNGNSISTATADWTDHHVGNVLHVESVHRTDADTTAGVTTDTVLDSPCLNISDTSVSPSSSFSSPPSAGGQCPSKRKVSLVEYRSRMRQKSGGTTVSNGKLSCSSSTDSDTNMGVMFDPAHTSPLLRPSYVSPPSQAGQSLEGTLLCSSQTDVITDASRDLVDSLNLSWSSEATAAERTLEKIQMSDKHLKTERESSSSSSYTWQTRDCHHPRRPNSPIEPQATNFSGDCLISLKSELIDRGALSSLSTGCETVQSGSTVIDASSVISQQSLGIYDAVKVKISDENELQESGLKLTSAVFQDDSSRAQNTHRPNVADDSECQSTA